jgi:hypothetical protein
LCLQQVLLEPLELLLNHQPELEWLLRLGLQCHQLARPFALELEELLELQ